MDELFAREKFDGVFGFSQGASMAAAFCERNENLKFAVLFGGFEHQWESKENESSDAQMQIAVPSFHGYGLGDEIVTKQRSLDLALKFKDATVFEHDGGHYIPSQKSSRDALLNFLSKI